MLTLSEGLTVVRIAEDIADVGASVLTDGSAATILEVARNPESLSLVIDQLEGDEDKAHAFIERILELAEHGEELDEDDEPLFVGSVAALGSLIVRAATEQTTGVFEAVSA